MIMHTSCYWLQFFSVDKYHGKQVGEDADFRCSLEEISRLVWERIGCTDVISTH